VGELRKKGEKLVVIRARNPQSESGGVPTVIVRAMYCQIGKNGWLANSRWKTLQGGLPGLKEGIPRLGGDGAAINQENGMTGTTMVGSKISSISTLIGPRREIEKVGGGRIS